MQEIRKERDFRISEYFVLFGLIALCIIIEILNPVFFSWDNIVNIFLQITINGILAIGLTMVIITAGIDLSVGSVLCLSGIVMGLTYKALGADTIWVNLICIAVAIVIGIACGLLNGVMITKGKLPPFIATLGMMSIARGAAFTISGGSPVYSLPESFLAVSGRVGILPIPALIMIGVFVLGGLVLKYTKLGRYTYAIGGNETASVLSGIGVRFYKTVIYTLSGLTCAVSAVLLTAKLDSAVPVAADGYELDAIASVVIGGTSMLGGEGKLSGTLIGALIIGVVNNGLNLLTVPQGPQRMVKGAIIILAVCVDLLRKAGRR